MPYNNISFGKKKKMEQQDNGKSNLLGSGAINAKIEGRC